MACPGLLVNVSNFISFFLACRFNFQYFRFPIYQQVHQPADNLFHFCGMNSFQSFPSVFAVVLLTTHLGVVVVVVVNVDVVVVVVVVDVDVVVIVVRAFQRRLTSI